MSRGEFAEHTARDLVRERESLGLTQEQVAEEAGVARGSLARWERGMSVPSAQSLGLLKAFFRARRRRAAGGAG